MKIVIILNKKQVEHIPNCDSIGDACSYWQEIGAKIKKSIVRMRTENKKALDKPA